MKLIFPIPALCTRRFSLPDDRTVIDSSILVVEPNKSIPVRKNIKNGQEILCVLKGSIELMLSEETFTLVEGDCVHFLLILKAKV